MVQDRKILGNRRKKTIHYAWVVCFGCALIFFCTCGLSCNVFSVYSPFIMRENGLSRTQTSLIVSVRSLFQMIAIVLTGRIYRRFRLRQGMLCAGLICAAGYLVYGLAKAYPVWLLGSAVVGFGYGMGAMVPISMVLERWFCKDQTIAVGIVSAASGLATIGIPSAVTAVIETRGLSSAFMMEGALIVFLTGCAFLLVRDNPSDLSIHAFGEKEKAENERYAAAEKKEEPAAGRELPEKYWLLLYGMVIISTTFNSACFSHLSLLATTEGYSPAVVALSLSTAGFALMAGKFCYGFLCAKLTLRRTSLIVGSFCSAAVIACCFIRLGSWLLFPAFACFGAGISYVSIGLVSWAMEWSRPEEHTKRVSRFQLVFSIGSLFANLLPGVLADLCGGSYVPFYALSAGCCVLVTLLVEHTYRRRTVGG